jgi:hypothetical protein
LATAPAGAFDCSHGKQPNTFCKACKDLLITAIAHRNTTVAGCDVPCSSFCGWKPNAQPRPGLSLMAEPPEQPDPRRDPMRGMDPSILEGLYDEDGKYCGPIPFLKPWNFYALEATDAQILAMAESSPPAAWTAAVSQIGGVDTPAPMEVGDGSYVTVINAAMVKLLVEGKQDQPEFVAAAPPLEGDLGFLTTTRVDRLRNGHRLIVVETELIHGPTLATVGIPYPPYAIEIERVAGKTRPNPDQPDNPARVWRVLSWGPPASYYR